MTPPLKNVNKTPERLVIKVITGKTQILKRQGKINNQKNQRKKGKQKGKKERKKGNGKGFLVFFLVKPWKMGKKESLAGNSLVCFL